MSEGQVQDQYAPTRTCGRGSSSTTVLARPRPVAALDLRRHRPGREEAHVLEVGCGYGKILWARISTGPVVGQPTLSDHSAGMVDARGRYSATARSTSSPDAQDLPFPDDAFDIVIAHHMLFHVDDCPERSARSRASLSPAVRSAAATIGLEHVREVRELARLCPTASRARSASASRIEPGPQQLEPFFGESRW